MADRAAGARSVTPVDASFMERIGMAVRFVFNGKTEWFGPREPLKPVAPEDVKGRAFDFQTGINVNTQPRAQEAISFQSMRTLADQYDVLRLVIETRKDQVAKLKWNVRPRDKEKKRDKRCDEIEALFRNPDTEHDWDTWVRALVEEMLVIDAATIYPAKNRGGKTISLDIIDGSTIKRVVGYDGRTPLDGPAYQQVLKGMPAVDFTKDELIYRPRNWRVHKLYGYSPVEQIIMTVNIALRRQMTQLAYYTEGNVPESLIGVPTNWTTEQIKQFQLYWDTLLTGDLAQKRRARFVPGDMKYQPTREPVIKDQYDEWLARIVCFAFSISPQPFVAMMNRATAETAQQAALEEGLAPIMNWLKSLMDLILAQYLDGADLEFSWDNEVELDRQAAATVHGVYLTHKVLTPDEVREEIGKEKLTPEQRAAAFPEPTVPGEGDDGGQPPPGKKKPPKGEDDDTKKAEGAYLGKRGVRRPFASRPTAPINRERRAVVKATKAIRTATRKALDGVLDEAIGLIGELRKADAELLRALEKLKFGSFNTFVTDVQGVFEELVADGGIEALAQIGLDDEDMLDLVNEKAVEWAKNHAANLVGKKWVKGKLIDNANAKYRIDERTREGINALVVQAESEGWSNDRLAKELRESYAFSDERAEMIARTETARADMAGNMIAYRESGLVAAKRWIVAQGDFCDLCEGNAKQGAIDFEEAFGSGDIAAPAHPNCRCDVVPVLAGDE